MVSRPLDVWIALILTAASAITGVAPAGAQESVPACSPAAEGSPTPGEETKLEECDGVLKPPAGIDPEMHLPSPDPELGELPVLPPPAKPSETLPSE